MGSYSTGDLLVIGEAMIELRGTGLDQGAFVTYGGDTINTAVYCRRSSASLRVHYVTALGDDPLSTQMIAEWRAEGISTDLVARMPGKLPGLYSIVTDDRGERHFYYWRAESAARELLRHESADTVFHRWQGCGYLYLTGITLAVLTPTARATLNDVVRRLRAAGTTVVFDSNYRPTLWSSADEARHAMEQALRLTNIALVSADDERHLWGDADPETTIGRLRGCGVQEIVVKNGDQPCWIAVGSELTMVPAVPGVRPSDTTAAGDAFNGAYIAARIAGHDTQTAAHRGHQLAARVITYAGAIIPRNQDADAASR